MRWLGLATRTLELCQEYITTRRAFGKTLIEHQLSQKKIADACSAIHAGNLMTFHCAWMIEQGLAKEARPYSSMCKNHVANPLCKTLDDAIQMHGGLGYSQDLPFGTWYRAARAGRLADGPDEVHVMVIARDYLRGLVALCGPQYGRAGKTRQEKRDSLQCRENNQEAAFFICARVIYRAGLVWPSVVSVDT